MFSLWRLATTRNKSFSVKVTDGFILNEETIKDFIWTARAEYYSKMLSWYQLGEAEVLSIEGPKRRARSIRSEKNMIVFSFLKSIGLLTGDKFTQDFIDKIRNGSINIGREDKICPRNRKVGMEGVFALALMIHAENAGVRGLPGNIIDEGSFMLMHFFEAAHNELFIQFKREFD